MVKFPERFLLGFSMAGATISTVLITAIITTIPTSAGAAGITQIAFTSVQQTIEPSVASARITVEIEDAAGNAVRGNTVCLKITSASASGEFSTNAESWSAEPIKSLALTISSNQYRRNFYYRDSSEGTFTLTAKAAVRQSGSTCSEWKGTPSWSASQQIVIDKNAAALAAAHDAEIAAASAPAAPKTESKISAPTTKKKTTKFVSKTISSESASSTSDNSPNTTNAAEPPSERSQVAAPISLFSDSLWWVAALGLVGAGCIAVVLSRKHAKKEWDIIEDKGD